jgi:uncharacterized protein (TIGR02284 family)
MQDAALEPTIRPLIDACERSARAYLDCARRCSRPELKSLLEIHANGCLDAAQSLVTLLAPAQAIGTSPMAGAGNLDDDRASGTVDELELLQRCEQAADDALDAYEAAVGTALPPSARSLVESQCEGARRTHDQIRALRDRAAADREAGRGE